MEDIVFDPQSAAFAADPQAVYAQLRAVGPWYWAEADSWLLARIADVERVALDRTMLRSMDEGVDGAEIARRKRAMNWHDMPYHERFVQTNLLESEGDTHDRLRSLIARAFMPKSIDRQRPAIQAVVDRLLDGLDGRDRIDFIADFAVHVPGHVIGNVLGVPDDDCPQLRIWSEEVVRFFDVGRDDADKARAEQATRDFHDYLRDLLRDRSRAPQEDLLSQLLEHQRDGQMSPDELIATAMLILMAGHGSTIDVLGSGLHALLRFPDQHAHLRADPDLMPSAIQEMFRFESPLPYFHRYATEPCEVGGRHFPVGTRFGLLYGAANRDPARFVHPDRFDIRRSRNRHVAFGGGTHFCLGNHLARLDMEVIFTTLGTRFTDIRLTSPSVTYKPGLSVRGPVALPIIWRAA